MDTKEFKPLLKNIFITPKNILYTNMHYQFLTTK